LSNDINVHHTDSLLETFYRPHVQYVQQANAQYSDPPNSTTLALHPGKPWNRNSLCNLEQNSLIRYHTPASHHLPTSDSAMPFCFHQLYRQLPEKFIYTKILYTNNPTLTNKTYFGNKLPIAPCRWSWVIWWHNKSRCSATGRGINLKMKT
jgi:hypothetical protein